MHVVATFDHSIRLEMALEELQEHGVKKGQIFAIPLEKRNKEAFFDTIHHSDGKSLFDGIALWGAFFCALMTIYGFVLHFGPVIWGMIGLVSGSIFGALLKVVTLKMYKNKEKRSKTEVVVLVDCEKDLIWTVETVLWNTTLMAWQK